MNNNGPKQSRSWCLTIAAETHNKADVEKKLKNYVYVGQLEKGGKTDFLHWQIYIENVTPIAFQTLKNKFPTCHIEPRNGSKAEAFAYHTKRDDTYQGESVGSGVIDIDDDGVGSTMVELRNEIVLLGKSVDEVIVTNPHAWRYASALHELAASQLRLKHGKKEREVEVAYIWGKTGTGKTRHVFDTYDFDDVYRVTSYKHPFDNYAGQDVLVLDEFYGQIDCSYFITILDRYAVELEARYSNRQAGFTKVLIISNIPLEQQYQQVQRNNPNQWNALLRRIGTVQQMLPGGVLVADSQSDRLVEDVEFEDIVKGIHDELQPETTE